MSDNPDGRSQAKVDAVHVQLTKDWADMTEAEKDAFIEEMASRLYD